MQLTIRCASLYSRPMTASATEQHSDLTLLQRWKDFFSQREKALDDFWEGFINPELWKYRKKRWQYWVGWFFAITYAFLCAAASIYTITDLGLWAELGFAAGIATLVANIAMFWVCIPIMLYRLFNKDFSIFHETHAEEKNRKTIYLKAKITTDETYHFHEVSPHKKFFIGLFTFVIAPISAFAMTAYFVSGVIPAFDEMGVDVNISSWAAGDIGWAFLLGIFSVISFVANWALATHPPVNYLARHDFNLAYLSQSFRSMKPRPGHLARDYAHLGVFFIFAGVGTYGLWSFFNASAEASIAFLKLLGPLHGLSGAFSSIFLVVGFIGYLSFATIAAYRGAGVVTDLAIKSYHAGQQEVSHIYSACEQKVGWLFGGLATFIFSLVYLPVSALVVTLCYPVHVLAAANAGANAGLSAKGAEGNHVASKILAGTGGGLGSANTYMSTQESDDDTQGEDLPYAEYRSQDALEGGKSVIRTATYLWNNKTHNLELETYSDNQAQNIHNYVPKIS